MDILEKSLLTAAVGIMSWLVKDLLIKTAIKRNEAARKEWDHRLKEIWSPLFYWSGVVSFPDSSQSWQKHGIKELESILAKSAHLLPLKHYYNLIKLIESGTNQKTSAASIKEVTSTRDYIYRQVELLNYLLYRHEAIYEADVAVDVLAPYRFLLRGASALFLHLLLWAAIAAIIVALYLSYLRGILWPIALPMILLSIVSYFDIRKRIQIYQQIRKLLSE